MTHPRAPRFSSGLVRLGLGARGLVFLSVSTGLLRAAAPALPYVSHAELQPLAAQVARLQEALDYLGAPLEAAEKQALAEAGRMSDNDAAVRRIEQIVDPHCLFGLTISPEMRLNAYRGPAAAELVEQGWRVFLVKVDNRAATTAPLQVASPNAQRVYNAEAAVIPSRWLEVGMFDGQPLVSHLSGLALEYRIMQIYSRDAGSRRASFLFTTPIGGQDQSGVRSDLSVTFDAKHARAVTFRVADENGQPTTASFVIKDKLGRVYPSPSKRLAPDFAFQHQIYRGDGDVVKLPDGAYAIEFSRGPESVPQTTTLMVDAQTTTATFRSKRWIDPSLAGWWSGDHHIHAAGCSHYEKPTEGVNPDDMIRQTTGEDLKVGANLTWGPGFDYQKQFFCGVVDKVSKYPYLLRYDIEVSGFGSHQSGHLCLLRLKEQIYPGGKSTEHWPTLGLNTLRWAKRQGAVTGTAHSGWGLQPAAEDERTVAGSNNADALRLASAELPNYVVPPFNGIGANEYIVDVTHEVLGPDGQPVPAIDFLAMVDTPHLWELNIWYHTLNAGFRTRISGETDFPCVYDEKVGLGRSYVKLDGPLDYDAWCEGIRLGRSYVSDGRSHLMDFKANDVALGEHGSELRLPRPGKVRLTARVAARLDEQPNPAVQRSPADKKPYWSIERARIGTTREVPVEVVLNGRPVARRTIVADGREQDIVFEVDVTQSSWVALRILPSSHTNPIFVLVGDQPIRASRRSVAWCLQGVDQCWRAKERFIKPAELDEARRAYAHAREVYQQRLAECVVD